MAGYFNYFPSTNYANNIATNIIAKVKFNESVQKNLAVFYDYSIQQGERADQIAYKYYNDAQYDWLIYLANDITDPYLEWFLINEQFDNYIKDKYGSIQTAQQKIAFYRNNYKDDDTTLTVSSYNSLNFLLKKYFKPVFDPSNVIVSYVRKELDQVLETNQVLVLSVGNTSFTENEKVTQGNNYGTLSSIGFGSITLTNISGSFSNTANVVGSSSNNSSNVSLVSVISQPISSIEATYWTPLSYYDYENELNLSRSIIKILDKNYVSKIEKDMRELFK